MDWPRRRSGGSDMGPERPHDSACCRRKQMVLDTVGATAKTTVPSQFSAMVGEGDL